MRKKTRTLNTKLHATKCHIIYTPLNRPFSRLDNLNFIFFKSFFKTRQMLRVYNNLVSDRAHSHFTLYSTFFLLSRFLISNSFLQLVKIILLFNLISLPTFYALFHHQQWNYNGITRYTLFWRFFSSLFAIILTNINSVLLLLGEMAFGSIWPTFFHFFWINIFLYFFFFFSTLPKLNYIYKL